MEFFQGDAVKNNDGLVEIYNIYRAMNQGSVNEEDVSDEDSIKYCYFQLKEKIFQDLISKLAHLYHLNQNPHNPPLKPPRHVNPYSLF